MIGILNINKPRGVSSSFVVVKLKKLLNTKKVGHMGTLDPLAQGVLPICVGKATKLFDYFLKKQKTYIATFQFGYQTSTLDLEGEIEAKCDVIPTLDQLKLATKKMLGKSLQLPPKYSSKKVGGKKACDLIRSGKDVELKPCEIELFNFKVLSQLSVDTFEFEITCSAGTYIRSIARDLAQSVGSLATMTKLVRTKSGNFTLETALDFDKLEDINLIENIIPLQQVLCDFEGIYITNEQLKTLLDGKNINVETLINSNQNNKKLKQITINNLGANLDTSEKLNCDVGIKFYKVICEDNIVGIAHITDKNNIKIKTYFI